ncbi:MAG: hypothetical protein FJ253_05440 [Phycisphaerae bacterium]|nr:hypothetical protein [Phycisphaerae bacterium]
MKVRTSFRRGPFAINLGFALFCLVGAVWGAYDYWVAYPAIDQANRELESARKVRTDIEAKLTPAGGSGSAAGSSAALLSQEDRVAYEQADETLKRIYAEYGGEPPKLAAYDRPLQLWLWVIGCGVLGAPFFAWRLIRMTRCVWTLDDDGTLVTPTSTIPLDEVVDIDMNRWCSLTGGKRSTWKAWLVLKDGRRETLDDHDYRDMHKIIGFYAYRFHPQAWTEDAKRVEAPEPEANSDGAGDAGAEGDAVESGSSTGNAPRE